MGSKERVAKAAGIIMIAMVLSRLLGFVRDAIMAKEFGQNYLTDAYFAAFTIPDFLYYLLVGGALSAAFIPVFSGYIAKGQEKEAWEVANTVINLIIILMVIGIALGIIFAPYLIPLVAFDFSGKTMELTVYLTRIMFPAVLFTGLNGLSMGILNSYQHFLTPALGSVVYNVGIILLGVLLAPYLGIAGFSIGVIAGAAGNFAVQLPALMQRGLRYRFYINLRHPGIKRLGELMVPALIGLAVSQINLVVNQNFASTLAEGSISALRLASRLMQLPIGVFGVAIGIAVFTTMTSQAAREETDDFRKTMSLGVRSVLFITLPSAAGLVTLGVPIIRLLFEQGKFDPTDTAATAYALVFYAIGVFAYSGIHVIVRAFYALGDPHTPVKVAIVTIFLNLGLNILLIKPLSHGGLALAYSLTGIYNMAALLFILRKKIGSVDGRNIAFSFGRSLLASLIMAVGVYYTAVVVGDIIGTASKLTQGLQVLLATAVGAGVYFALALAFKMEEIDMIVGIAKRRFAKRG